MNKIAVVFLVLLISTLIQADSKVSKLRETAYKRLDELKESPVKSSRYTEFLTRFEAIELEYSTEVAKGLQSDANTRFQADTIHMLIDIFEVLSGQDLDASIA